MKINERSKFIINELIKRNTYVTASEIADLLQVSIKTITRQLVNVEKILNENDLVVGARFDNGTIQDYIDENKTYGLVRIEDSTANWFLFNKDESEEDLQKLYEKILKEEHFIQNDFGEEIVVFNKTGNKSFEDFIKKIDEYLGDELGNFI